MLIDWFTVGAQVFNFLILVWLLKRYLYQPILNAIDAREQRIAAEIADADAKRAEAQTERDTFQRKNAECDQQRAELMLQATDAANIERKRLFDDAQKAAEAMRIKYRKNLVTEAQHFNQVLSSKVQQEVFAIVRKTLDDMATTSLEECMSEVFVRRLHELDSVSKAALATAVKTTTTTAPALLRSTFDLPMAQRTLIKNALNQSFSADVSIQFETAPELISGIEFSANGQKIAWSIAEYLTSLERGIDTLLQEKMKTDTQPS